MGDKGMIITEESPETEGFFGIGAEKKGCLWRNYREKRSCDICLKSFERDVFTGLYTGAFEFPFFGLKRVFVGYKKRPFDFCDKHPEIEVKKAVDRFLTKKKKAG